MPEVEWIYPTEGSTGGGDVITVAGTNLADVRNLSGVVLECKVDGTRTATTFLDDDAVTCQTPPHREGWVHVEFTLNGETSSCPSNSPKGAGFQYIAAGSVKSVFPFTGDAGTVLEVRGDDLKPSYLCRVGETPVASHFASSTLIRCEAPNNREESVGVDVSNPVGAFGQLFSDVEFQYAPRAILASVSPRMGNSMGGTVLSVTGRNFANTNALKCKVGTIETNGVWRGSTTVECVSPAAMPTPPEKRRGHSVQISTNQRDFTTGETKFLYQELSGVDAASPAQLPDTGGSHVSVHLALAHPAELPKCRFGSHTAPGLLEAGSGYMSCVSPAGSPGFVAVHVARNGEDFEHLPPGKVEANAVIVEMKVAMEIDLVYPEVGFRGGGSVVRVSGNHMVFDDVRCKFGSIIGPAHAISSALLLCETPEHEAITVALELAVAAATAIEPLVRPNFIFDELPVVTGVNPSGGPVEGGNTVTAAGYHFSEMHDMGCRFGTIGPVAGEWIAADEFRCSAPAHVPDFADFNVGIKNDFAVQELSQPTIYEYVVTPTMTTVMDNEDGTVSVIGTGFQPGAKVYCNLGVDLGFVPGTVQDSNTIVCNLPDNMASNIDPANTVILDEEGNNVLSPTSDDGDGSSGGGDSGAGDLAIANAPSTIDNVGPTSGPTWGGTTVVIQGDNFAPTTTCRFGQNDPVPAIFISSNQIVCESPAQPHGGAATVEVSNNGLDWTSAGYVFAYQETATLGHVAPRQGSVDGGSVLRLTGTEMPNTEVLSCRVGTISHIASRWLSATTSSCHIPAHTEGIVPMGLQSHAADWDVYDIHFAYTPPPNVTSVYPLRGAVSGGTRVTVEGVNFPSTGRAACRFGSTAVSAFQRTATRIICASPSLKAGMTTVEVSVNRQDFTMAGLQFQYVAMPQIFGISPKTGPSFGGTLIAIQGEHFSVDASFDDGTGCAFSNITMVNDISYVVSSRLMLCEVPANNLGNAQVELSINVQDTTSDLQTFRFMPPPEVEGVFPMSGSEAGGGMVVVHGSFFFDSDDVSCRVGTISGVQASTVTADEIQCLMPGHVPGAVQLDVTLNRYDHTQEEVSYIYEQVVSILGPIPTRVLAEGGGEVLLSFWPADTDSSLNCVVDAHPVPATKIGVGTFTCITPPHSPGFVAINMRTADSEEFSKHSTILEYQVTPFVTDLNPPNGIEAGVAVIKASGHHMVGHEVFCRLGFDGLISAEQVSSALLKCEAPAHEAGRVVIEVSTSDDGQQFSHSDMVYEYAKEFSVVGVEPRDGSQSGGTIVRLALSMADAPLMATCRFGTIGPIASRSGGGGIECAAPAQDGGPVTVAASSNIEVWGVSEVAFEYLPSASVYAVSPAFSSTAGGVLVVVMGSQLEGDDVRCRFGMEVSSGVLVGGDELCIDQDGANDRCFGWMEVMCVSPPHAAGVVTLEVGTAESGFSTSKIEFAFQPEAAVRFVQPASGPTAGVGVVKVGGEHLIGDSVLCGFGSSDPVNAEMVSSVLVKCEAPAHSPGMVSLELSTSDEGQQFSHSGMVYEYADEAVVVGLEPREGPQSGGTIVRLALGDALDASSVAGCRFGTIGPLSSRVAGYGAECAAPAREGGLVAVSASSNNEVWGMSEAAFEYMSSAAVYAVAPSAGPISGGTAVRVMGSGMAGVSVRCRFGMEVVMAEYVGGDELCIDQDGANDRCFGWMEVTCVSPPHAAGIVSLEVSASEGGFSTSKIEFAFQPEAAVRFVQPASGPTAGVGVVKVGGEHLIGDSVLCGFGSSDPVNAEMVSSVLVKCEAPAHSPGMVSLELSTSDEGQQFSHSGMVYEYADEAVVVGLEPREGPQSGGTIVRLALGDALDASSVAGCRFGTIGPLSSRVAGYGAECAAPAREGGLVAVSASSNNEVWGMSEAAFEYMSSAAVYAVAPSAGPISGGTAVRVMGSGMAGVSVRCRFGMEVVMAEYVGGDELCIDQDGANDRCFGWKEVTCVSPPHAAGIVSLEVSASEGGFSTSKIEFAFQPEAAVRFVQPASGPTAGVGVVKVGGEHLIGDSVLCGFGSSDPVNAEMVSSVLVKCEAPAHSPGMVSLELSTSDEGQQFSHSGMVYEYADEAVVVGLEPREGPQSGGTIVRLALGDALDASSVAGCRFGTIGPLSSRVAGYGAECAAPAREGGLVAVSASSNNEVWGMSEAAFEYMSSATVYAIEPAVSTAAGGAAILVAGSGLRGDTVRCRFGLEIVIGEYIGGDELCVGHAEVPLASCTDVDVPLQICLGWVEVMCVSPPHAAGIVSLEVSASEGGFSTSKIEFAFQPEAAVRFVQPASGPTAGVGVVKVGGEHLIGDSVLCGFGSSDPVNAEMVSSVLVKCEAPARDAGVAPVEVRVAGVFTDLSILYTFEDDAMAVAATPSRGPQSGGTIVQLVHSDRPSSRLACAFGPVFPVAGRVDASALSCASPSMTRHGGPTPLTSMYASLVASSAPLAFSYAPTPRAEFAVTTATSIAGGTTVALVATDLPASASPTCRFGDVVVPATRADAMFLSLDAAFTAYDATTGELEDTSRAKPSSPTIVLCVAPPGGAGFMTVDISLETFEGGSFDVPSRRAAVEFSYETTARVSSASPSTTTSAGGTLVRLTGAHFTPSRRSCGFGDVRPFGDVFPSTAVFVSAALVVCESSAREEGSRFHQVGFGGSAFSPWTAARRSRPSTTPRFTRSNRRMWWTSAASSSPRADLRSSRTRSTRARSARRVPPGGV